MADQLARHDSVFAKIDSLCSTVQHHSESFEAIRKSNSESFDLLRTSMASQQAVMAEMMVKLQQLDKPSTPSPQPHPLPLPTSPPLPMFQSHLPFTPPSLHPPGSISPPRLPRIEVPLFTGEHALSWLFQINHYFHFHQIPDDHRIAMAAFYMTGQALQWFQWLYSTSQLSHWDDFVRKLELRFGPSSFVNNDAALFKLRQMSTVTDYLNEFECLSTRVTGLNEEKLLNCFLSGLRDDIQRELYILKPGNLHDAMGMARLVEDKCNAGRSLQPRLTWPKPPPQLSPAPINRTAPLPIKRLSPVEMAAWREKGLCFNCDSKFTPCHKCKPAQFLCLLVDQEDGNPPDGEPPSELEHQLVEGCAGETWEHASPSISFHALMGHVVPSTLKLVESINGQEVLILVDGGSTNNFIQNRLASQLKLVVQPSAHTRVSVGNGDALTCGGECSVVPLKVGDAIFMVNLILLPIYGADLVLGVEWLLQLGLVLFDYENLWMEFNFQGSHVRLQGLTQPQSQLVRPASLPKTDSDGAQFFQLSVESIEPANPDHVPSIGSEAPVVFLNGFNSLLINFSEIFKTPTGLPPPRAQDHCITLTPGAPPVNVKPYRYPYFQKSEIEKLVGEMLSDGIIRPSTSPFSSHVLLVKKKDSTWRFCVDYRALNAVTIKDRFPIPTVEELLDEVAGSQIFSKLDLRAGYHQVRIHPNDVEKTAFRTHEGHYEFLVMPFGLTNAPSTFQSLMNNTFSQDWTSHLTHLTEVFGRLRDHRLFTKLSKCEFGCTSIGYLGHIISGEGVAVDPEKIQAIREWPLPVLVKALRGFLGLCGYYRRFVDRYAALAAPLTELLRKNAFVWTPATTQAFQTFKEANDANTNSTIA
ncbi:uncharacterized protein LOC120275588 [Dioscorea cayenensis subsp. rotundata]|uniref:Uncharacterized protein LOC120275588 n=1 Tax=Dioscorea cayennensis subsp. rotundata TaxID=55577 RepID=A0AB40CE97_DIOCR|nr:uncharacterized protein LOC120275588 [Dioscorea cayenensis subsp. rotundata]